MDRGVEKGIAHQSSTHSVDATIERINAILRAKGITIFALIDHSGEAERAGLKMRPTKLLLFGNPKAGTPLMLAAPSCALDLPLKLLVWEDAQQKVRISYDSLNYLQARHEIPPELMHNIAVIEPLAAQADA